MAPLKELKMTKEGFINESRLEFDDISSETFRKYRFPSGKKLRIHRPLYLNVSKSNGHRLYSKDVFGRYTCWYVKPSESWYIKWRVKKAQPDFVK